MTHDTLEYGELPKDRVDLGITVGPFFLAQCFNWCLYGILCLQVYIYVLRFHKDLACIKRLVTIVFFLDTFSIALVTHAAWQVLVSHWGDINIFHGLPWTWASVPISSGVISGIVQMFFVWRIWKLSQSLVMPFIITVVIIEQATFAIRTGFIAAEVKNFSYIHGIFPAFWLGGSILADILITITLGHILWARRTGFKHTDSVIMRIIRLTIEAAAIPTIFATCKLILIYNSHNNKHLVFCVPLARLYSNALLAMLNCRDELLGGGPPDTTAAAARLSDEASSKSMLRHLLDKFGTRSHGSVNSLSHTQTRTSRSYFIDASVLKNKILVCQHTVRDTDVDLEAAQAVEHPYYSSHITFDNPNPVSPMNSITSTADHFSSSPNRPYSAAPLWGRPLSAQPQVNNEAKARTYETHSQYTPPFYPDGSPVSPAISPSYRAVLTRPKQTHWAGQRN